MIPEVKRAAAAYEKTFHEQLKQRPLYQTAKLLRRSLTETLRPWRMLHPQHPSLATPACLRPPSYTYQGQRGNWFEEFFFRHHDPTRDAGLEYLPIFWDHFFLHTQSGNFLPGDFKQRYAILWDILEQARQSDKRYFTILGMYDFPIWDWHRFPENILVFSCAGWGDVPLPMLKGERTFKTSPTRNHTSFIGNLQGYSDSEGTRSRMHSVLRDVATFDQGNHWEDLMASSRYSLCPRGLGPTSFRLFEAISLGSIPIYIWDKRRWLPFEDEVDWSEFIKIFHIDELPQLKRWLQSPESITWSKDKKDKLHAFHKKYCNYQSVREYIYRKLKTIRDDASFKSCVVQRQHWNHDE